MNRSVGIGVVKAIRLRRHFAAVVVFIASAVHRPKFSGSYLATYRRKVIVSVLLASTLAVLAIYAARIVMGAGSGVALGPQYSGLPAYPDAAYKFEGNTTSIQGRPMDSSSILAYLPHSLLVRQADCSLTGYVLTSYNAMTSMVGSPAITGYDRHLHDLAGLTTTPGIFAKGCKDQTVGLAGSEMVVLGKTSSGKIITAFIDENNNNLHTALVDPAGSFSDTQTSLTNIFTLSIGDFNGDGINDLLITGVAGSNQFAAVMLSHGDGTYSAPVTIAGGRFNGVLVDDFNGDGKEDVAVAYSTAAGFYSPIQILPGNGDGTFGAAIVGITPPGLSSASLASGDFNGDGRRDIVLGVGVILFGNGDGTFTAKTSTATTGNFAVVGDFNNDGKDDVASVAGTVLSVSLGNGDGTFKKTSTYASLYGGFSLFATDIDGDGNVDLVVGDGSNGIYKGREISDGIFMVLMGKGDGTFVGAKDYPNTVASTENGSFAVGDFNGDGNLDVLTASYTGSGGAASLILMAGDGKGALTAQAANTSVPAKEVFAADMNGDGKLDAVAVTIDSSTTAVGLAVLNVKGDGTFATPAAYPLFASSTGSVDAAVADLRGTGKPDVLVTIGGLLYLMKNNGDGTLGTITLIDDRSAGQSSFLRIMTRDLNGDGKPDLIADLTNTTAAQTLIYLNKGDGTLAAPVSFSPGGAGTTTSFTNVYGASAVADVNKDGKLDLVIAYSDPASGDNFLATYLGNGDGTYRSASLTPLLGLTIGTMSIADADHDGNPDILMAGCCGHDLTSLALGRGDGTFALNYALSIGAQSHAVAFADLNNDGLQDIIINSGNGLITSLSLYTAATTPATTTTTLSISPNPATLGQTVTFTAQVTGTGGIPGGTVTFTAGATTLGSATLDSSGSTSFSTSSLTTGTYSITANYTGGGTFSSSTSSPITLSVNAVPVVVPTTTTLATSATTIVAGTNLTFTASVVASSGSSAPSGTITFYDGTSSLGTGTLASGRATYATTGLAVGTHSITATYGGDATYSSSTSTAASITVTSASSDFGISLAQASGTVNAGSSATSTITITPVGGFNQQVNLACSGAPKNAACSISPASVTPNGTTASTATITIQTNVKAAMLQSPAIHGQTHGSGGTISLGFLGGGLLSFALVRRRRRSWRYAQLGLAMLILATSALMGCGSSGNSTPKGTSTLTVTASSGSISHTATYALTVQ